MHKCVSKIFCYDSLLKTQEQKYGSDKQGSDKMSAKPQTQALKTEKTKHSLTWAVVYWPPVLIICAAWTTLIMVWTKVWGIEKNKDTVSLFSHQIWANRCKWFTWIWAVCSWLAMQQHIVVFSDTCKRQVKQNETKKWKSKCKYTTVCSWLASILTQVCQHSINQQRQDEENSKNLGTDRSTLLLFDRFPNYRRKLQFKTNT